MVSCTQCNKQIKTAQGLRGHMQFAHKISSDRSGTAAVERATLATVAQLEQLRADTLEELELAGEQLRAATASLRSAVAQLPQQVSPAGQRQVLEGSDHGDGLCDSGQCARCRDYRKGQGPVVFRQGRKILMEEIDSACELAGVVSARDVVVSAVIAYRAKEQPGVDLEPLDAVEIEGSDPMDDWLQKHTSKKRAGEEDAISTISAGAGAEPDAPDLDALAEAALAKEIVAYRAQQGVARSKTPSEEFTVCRAPDGTLIKTPTPSEKYTFCRAPDGTLIQTLIK